MTVLRVLAAVPLLAWVWLALLRGMYWRTDVRLAAAPDPAGWPSVAVIVPARNEAEVLPQTLPTLVTQDYAGAFTVTLVDDGSTDGSGEYAATQCVPVVDPGEPPHGWAGKLWALRSGVEAVGDVDYFLFTDADIAHRSGSLSCLVRVAEADRLDVVSQMARLRVQTG
ncbi:MAG TPA: glycosyltransferase, partial [Micromonosporaceae bacterium]